ncbi:unnamed protein product [Ectocarpus sp. 13 AM-2016]
MKFRDGYMIKSGRVREGSLEANLPLEVSRCRLISTDCSSTQAEDLCRSISLIQYWWRRPQQVQRGVRNYPTDEDYVDHAVRHVMMRQGVLGVTVSIMLPHDPTVRAAWARRDRRPRSQT